MYEIILSDGAKIENVEMNGNNYIPKKPIDTSIFEGKTSTVDVVDGEGVVETITDFKVIFAKVSEEQSFIIHKKTKEEISTENMAAEINEQAEIVADILGGVFNA